jgi:hypothetical protein
VGRGCTPRSRVSACHGSRTCTPRSYFSPCREGRGCTPRSCISASRGCRGCTPRSCVCLSWGQALHATQPCFSLPWGQGLHSAQLYFSFPWGQGLHTAQCFSASHVSTVSLPSRLVSHGIAEIPSPAACVYRIVATNHRGGIISLESSVGARHARVRARRVGQVGTDSTQTASKIDCRPQKL